MLLKHISLQMRTYFFPWHQKFNRVKRLLYNNFSYNVFKVYTNQNSMIKDGRGKIVFINFSNVVDLRQVTCTGEAKRFLS